MSLDFRILIKAQQMPAKLSCSGPPPAFPAPPSSSAIQHNTSLTLTGSQNRVSVAPSPQMPDEFLFRPNPEVISGVEPIYKLQTFYYKPVVASKSHERQNLPGNKLCLCFLSALCRKGSLGQHAGMTQSFTSRKQSVKGKHICKEMKLDDWERN